MKYHPDRKPGAALRQIGDAFGISGERVRQLFREHFGSTKITDLLTAPELAKLASTTLSYVRKLRYRGVIQSLKVSGRKYTLWGADSVSKIIEYESSYPDACRVCSSRLPSGRSVYCGDTCYIQGCRLKKGKGTK